MDIMSAQAHRQAAPRDADRPRRDGRRRVVLVTGASRNIGRGIADTMARAGHDVAVNARDATALEAVVDQLHRHGVRATACPGDVRDAAQVDAMIAHVERELGGIDVLVNNAVQRAHGGIDEVTDEQWHTTLDVVLTGTLRCVRAVLPGMRARQWGRIVNLAGISGQRGATGRIGLVTAKAGLLGLTKALARELAPDGITVNAVSPGLIDTDRSHLSAAGSLAQHDADQVAQVPLGRLGQVAEVAEACRYLSDDAAFVTGQTLAVNGGLRM